MARKPLVIMTTSYDGIFYCFETSHCYTGGWLIMEITVWLPTDKSNKAQTIWAHKGLIMTVKIPTVDRYHFAIRKELEANGSFHEALRSFIHDKVDLGTLQQ